MKQKRLLTGMITACICAQMSMSAFALEGNMNAETMALGPGYMDAMQESGQMTPEQAQNAGGPGASLIPWVKQNNVYIDSEGNAIDGAILRGISVSKWQGDINWGKVAADDVSFAYIRMGSFGYEGEYTMDPTYDKNMREARANGIHVAPYVYLQTRTVEEAREAARYALEQAAPYNITYPLAVDVEDQYIMDLSTQELTDIVNAFCEVIQAGGYQPIIYSDRYKFTNEMDTTQFPYELWFARYGTDHTYPNRTIWQSTDKGQIDGINGYVCLEFAFKDYAPANAGGQSDDTPGWWLEENGIWYFCHQTGRYTGWIKHSGIWYYLDPANAGAMLSNTTAVIDGVSYSFDASGAMQ